MLDARDGLLEDLSMQTGIKVSEDKLTGRMDVMLADGRPLVSGSRLPAESRGQRREPQ